jgi:hypothetical protein
MFLHRWQVDALIDTLGPHASAFGLDVWIDGLDRQQTGIVLPRDRWAWVQQQLESEIVKRELGSAPRPVCPHTPPCGNLTNCDNLQQIAAWKAAH